MPKHKVLSLRPYPGEVWHCKTLKELRRQYEVLCREPYPYQDDQNGGRYVRVDGDSGPPIWLVWGATIAAVAHEFAHVLLYTFDDIGSDPREGKGEPFCYMLSQLLIDAGIK